MERQWNTHGGCKMVVLAIHGGAGGDGPWGGPTELDPTRIACMERTLSEVGAALAAGELNALDAVTEAVRRLEDEPLFNAGRGSVIAADGSITMDASIMRGSDGAAGACAQVRNLRNPILLAKHLLEKGWPLMLIGDPADTAGEAAGLEKVDLRWLHTELRQAQWQKWKQTNSRPGSTDEDDEAIAFLEHDLEQLVDEPDGMGTVGAVAIDKEGGLAAATSTGGMTGKPPGRIGDSPIIGAGTWADNKVAISCTGVGEAFIRKAAAHRFADLVELSGMEMVDAAERVLDEVAPIGGRGGLIAVSASGEVILPFRTTLMYRGTFVDGAVNTAIGPNP